jgi:hypothetical protein
MIQVSEVMHYNLKILLSPNFLQVVKLVVIPQSRFHFDCQGFKVLVNP